MLSKRRVCSFSYVSIIFVSLYLLHYVIFASFVFFFFKQKTAYEMRISDWSSDVCSSDLLRRPASLAWSQTHQPTIISTRTLLISSSSNEIGRASCRERVCQYV